MRRMKLKKIKNEIKIQKMYDINFYFPIHEKLYINSLIKNVR